MTLRKTALAMLVAAALAPLAAQAQYSGHPPSAPAPAQAPQRVFTQAELDQMLAPIALYPDALLSQVLMAATYPIEVVEAARWTRANPGLTGDAAVRAVQNQDWDPSVQSLVAFPQILQRMDEQLGWTESLGDAFLAQEPMLMDTVQQLRQRAERAGYLRSTAQIRVIERGPLILVEPAADVVYVPYYDPLVVYGGWWWPSYRPVHWAPWPGYARAPGASVGLWFGRPSGISLSFFFGDFDWGRHAVRVVRPNAFYYRAPRMIANNAAANRGFVADRGTWQHDPAHRRGVHYRNAEVQQRFAAAAQVERREPPRPQAAIAPAARQEQRQEQRQDRRDDRREARQEPRPQAPQQRDQAQAAERAQQQQQRQQAEAARTQQQRQQAEAGRAQQHQQRQQAEAARAQQRQQTEAAHAQQRQQAEAGRAQQQAQRQQAEAARAQQQQQRQEHRQDNKQESRERRNEQHGERERGEHKG